MNTTLLKKLLNDLKINIKVHSFEELDSTNTTAKELARNGEEEFSLIIADRQRAGRGRLGRSFFSSENNGLYMSLIIRPKLTFDDALLITPAVATGISKALDEYKLGTKIKWVNDIFLNDRKICGILTESSFGKDGLTDWAVVGIGINVTEPTDGFPKEIENIAGALFKSANEAENKEIIASKIIASVIESYKGLPKTDFIKDYCERSLLTGKSVTLPSGEAVRVLGISERCGLIIEHSDKTVETLISSDVSVKLKTDQ